MTENASVLNELFAERLEDPSEKTKIAAAGSDFIADHLREETFADGILPPRNVTKDDPGVQRSVNHDTLVYLAETEPFSRGASMSFRSNPDVHYVRSARFEVPFHRLGSMRYEVYETDLMAYKHDILEVIRRNISPDIGDVKDRVFVNHCESACEMLQKDANSVALTAKFSNAKAMTARNVAVNALKEVGKCKSIDVVQNTTAANDGAGVTEALEATLQKDDVLKLIKLFIGTGGRGSRLRINRMLMTDRDFADISSWVVADAGDKIVGETTTEGYKHSTLVNGTSYVRTIKVEILRPGNIFGFAEPKFFGGSLVLNKPKFFADKERDKISLEAWTDVAVFIGNITGVRKLELYAGASDAMDIDGNATDNAAILADRAPFAEDKLGTLNNLVEQDGNVPFVSSF